MSPEYSSSEVRFGVLSVNPETPSSRGNDGIWGLHRQISGGPLQLDAVDLERLLPVDRKKLLLDKVISLQPGVHGVAEKAVTAGSFKFRSQQRDEFLFPSTQAFSALEQLALVILLSAEGLQSGDQWPSLSSINEMKVAAEMVEPGLLHIHARIVDQEEFSSGALKRFTFEGVVSVNGEDFVAASWEMEAGKS